VLTKDLLRVSRAGGGYHPRFAGRDQRPLAARVLGTYQGHVGKPFGRLQSALSELETDASDFKLVRGFAKLLDREATFETKAVIPPDRARTVAFEAAEAVGVATEAERDTSLRRAANRLDSQTSKSGNCLSPSTRGGGRTNSSPSTTYRSPKRRCSTRRNSAFGVPTPGRSSRPSNDCG
jgi:predicted nuclease of restriction endonuclease-like RecB superfamily